jgi:uncharacterized FlgJ-related protein
MKQFEQSHKERRAAFLRRKWGMCDATNASLEATRKYILEMLQGRWEHLKSAQREYFESVRRYEARWQILQQEEFDADPR